MLSLQKLLVLIAIVGAVWYGFKMFARFQALRQQAAERELRERKSSRKTVPAEDMVLCSACGAYVTPAGGSGCARPDCPYGA